MPDVYIQDTKSIAVFAVDGGFALYGLALLYPMKELFDIVRDGWKKYELA